MAEIDVFLIAGQSNAAGYGNKLQLDPVPSWAQNSANGWEGHPTQSSDSGYQFLHPTLVNFPCLYNANNTGLSSGIYNFWGRYLGERQTAAGTYSEDGSYGPELSFAWKYKADHPTRQLAVIKQVLGGSSLENDWMPVQGATPAKAQWTILKTMIDQVKARAAASGDTLVWKGFLWHQGESGASGYYTYLVNDTSYATKLRAFLASIRAETDGNMPCLIARIGNHMLADNIINPTYSNGNDTPDNRRGATNLRRDLQLAVGTDAGNIWVDTDNLPVLQTGSSAYWYHHTGAGYLAMGERFYARWQVLVGETPPPPPPPLATVVKFAGVEQPTKTAVVKLNGAVIGGNNDTLEVDVVDR